MRERSGIPVIGVVGDSGAGKTTLLERLVPALADRGLRVGVVKHASHGFEADRPGKDSHRIFGAGACAVALASDAQIAVFARREPRPVHLDDALARLPADCHAVLVEGFAWEPVPRVVVVREGTRATPRYTEPGPVLEVIAAPPPTPHAGPAFPAARIEALAARLADRVLERAA